MPAQRHQITLAIAPLLVAALVACTDNSPVAPTESTRLAPSTPAMNVVAATAGSIQLCAVGGTGLHGYTLSFTPGPGSSDTYATPLGTSFNMMAGTCATVFTASLTEPLLLDPVASVLVTHVSGPVGTAFDHSLLTEYDEQAPCTPACGADVLGTSSAITGRVNAYHGTVISTFSVPLGCAFSQGYWKNHTDSWPSPYSPDASFFGSGSTWLEMFNMPPRGSAYVQLAHQYEAAALSVANGAYMPPSTKPFFDAAAAFFGGGASGNLLEWADKLDSYNNGLAAGGPPHCG